MTDSLSHTAYQKGTHLYHALIESNSVHTFQVKLIYAIPIEDDPTESWLADYPLELHISRDEALKTLAQTKQFEDQLRAKLHEKRLVSVRENFISEIDRLEHQIEIAERDLFFELTTILGHRPTTEELQTIVDLPTAIENETARRRILDSHKRVKIPVPKTPSEIAEEEDFAKWVAGLPTKPTAPSQTEKDAKEREEYRGYRALIERVERGYKK